MKRIISIISLGLLSCTGLRAQAQHTGEWSAHAGFGISTFDLSSGFLKSEKGELTLGVGGNLGVDYKFFFTPDWGVSLGLEAAFYNGSIPTTNINTEQQVATPPDLEDKFFLRTLYKGFEESQTATLLQIPLMVHYEINMSTNSDEDEQVFAVAAGIKYGIPLSGSYKQTIKSITTTGYSEHTNQVYENMPNHGFETLNNVHQSGDLSLKNSVIVALEAGLKWKVKEQDNHPLFTGLYWDINHAIGIKVSYSFGRKAWTN
ncbi:MAG: PorT family protein [Candidatus Symbiothrix sp.]|jgi:outer membrane protein W|nr:PorT family protein [Candidatus Symbiothrix sp.]